MMIVSASPPSLSEFDLFFVVSSDPHGRLFGRWVTQPILREAVDQGVPASSCSFGWDVSQEIGAEVRGTGYHTGWHDILLRPEIHTLRPLPWLERTALVFADVVDQHGHHLAAVAPRALLKRQVQALQKLELQPQVGLELEFYLFRGSYDEVRAAGYRDLAPSIPYRAQDLIDHRTLDAASFFTRLHRTLDAMGVPLHSVKPEWGLGQWEVTLLHADPLALADRHALLKLAIKTAARQSGLAATFMAKPFAGLPGSSCHLHLSLRATGELGRGAGEGAELSPLLRHAVGGVMSNTSGLLLMYAPNVNSYTRVSGSGFAGHGSTWGFDNRTVTCRVVGSGPASRRFEFRVPGADANAYLALSGLLASVADGVSRQMDPGEPVTGNAYEHARSPFPTTLATAAAALRESAVAVGALGAEAVDHLVSLAEFEWLQYTQSVSDWETERYFEVV